MLAIGERRDGSLRSSPVEIRVRVGVFSGFGCDDLRGDYRIGDSVTAKAHDGPSVIHACDRTDAGQARGALAKGARPAVVDLERNIR